MYQIHFDQKAIKFIMKIIQQVIKILKTKKLKILNLKIFIEKYSIPLKVGRRGTWLNFVFQYLFLLLSLPPQLSPPVYTYTRV